LTGLQRARFCELLGPRAQLASQQLELFLLGLLSIVDALVGRPMDELLGELPLAAEVKETLLGGSSPLATVYQLARAWERGDWGNVARLADRTGVTEAGLGETYRESVAWAEQMLAPSAAA
jgi:EAL and modified HD-GYP domain-containing signal transduction protein